ncbi:hypothetical protein CC2G_008336 [Coprinopsis cinerea AmutBmut pab1-1]|nr:hypothetical protein CC2G_008336 [Coprinopsis cinerea AmutBmut pab1-1]
MPSFRLEATQVAADEPFRRRSMPSCGSKQILPLAERRIRSTRRASILLLHTFSTFFFYRSSAKSIIATPTASSPLYSNQPGYTEVYSTATIDGRIHRQRGFIHFKEEREGKEESGVESYYDQYYSI